MWVRSEYAGELAVLSTWVCALLPWSFTYASRGGLRLIRIHFLYIFFQFAPGSSLGGFLDGYMFLHQAPTFADNPTVTFGYQLWILGGLLFLLPLGVSITYYLQEARLERHAPIDPVRIIGGLLGLAAIPLAGATYFVASGAQGYTIPIGVIFMIVLGGLLLIVERT